jgi:hypothetical protein
VHAGPPGSGGGKTARVLLPAGEATTGGRVGPRGGGGWATCGGKAGPRTGGGGFAGRGASARWAKKGGADEKVEFFPFFLLFLISVLTLVSY